MPNITSSAPGEDDIINDPPPIPYLGLEHLGIETDDLDADLELETTYTGKCLAEIRERARRGALGEGPILFWNTFSSVDVKQRAPRPFRPAELPGSLRRLFE